VGAFPVCDAAAQEVEIKAQVRAVKGSATYSTPGAKAKPIKLGAQIPSKSTVKTGPKSTVDLYLGPNAGTVQVAPESTLTLAKLTLNDTGAEKVVEVQLELPDGEMYFNANKMSKASRYEIKMPNGVAGIRGTKGRFGYRPGKSVPPVVLVTGTVVFVHAGGKGKVASHVMKAPPAVYFTPGKGIQPAPPGMVGQVQNALESMKKHPGPPPNVGPPLETIPPEPFLSPGEGAQGKGKGKGPNK
jgi:hypothetical protein